MKQLWMIVAGLLLSGALWGVTAATAPALSAQQRATSTPTAMPRLPVTLVARPLPAVLPITATPALTISQIITLPVRATPTPTPRRTPVSRSTPTRTPTATQAVAPAATPTRTPTATQAVAPSAADGDPSTAITDFTAQASRLRGQIDLRWGYAGAPFDGVFIVERSANGGVWRYVEGCTQPYTPNATSYRCPDSGLTSGATYLYRACVVDYGASCAALSAALSEPVRAP